MPTFRARVDDVVDVNISHDEIFEDMDTKVLVDEIRNRSQEDLIEISDLLNPDDVEFLLDILTEKEAKLRDGGKISDAFTVERMIRIFRKLDI